MNVYVNGEYQEVMANNIQELLKELNIESEFIAVALNEDFVAKSEYQQTSLNPDCRIEIVAPNQGG